MQGSISPGRNVLLDANRFSIDDLLVAAAFPHPVTQFQLKETHISWVVLTGSFAYKIKKPVRYDFIDASTLERRRILCEEELRLNRRFAPDLYAGVVAIVCENGHLSVGGPGEPLEFAVKMRQFDPALGLAEQLDQDEVTPQDMSSLAALLADIHVRAVVAPTDSPFGTFQRVREHMLDNFRPLRRHLSREPERLLLERLATWTNESLTRLEPLIQSRRHSGAVRECHGDLHSRNIVRWRQQWLPFDCLEFDPELRWIDVISDVAFLFMDLASRGREDLACEFMSRYLEETGDYAGLRLLPLYASYFALVRAKVDALGAETADSLKRLVLENRLSERLATAVRFMDAGRPALIIMHGVTASGKSWLSEQLVTAVRALRIRSDRERKRLEGIAPLARRDFDFGEGAYGDAPTRRTYDRLLELADSALDGHCNVVVDAAFLDPGHRESFHRLALRRRCPFLIVSCTSDATTLASRLQTRIRTGLDPSEATQAVLDQQLYTQQPLTAEELQLAIRVDTNHPGSTNEAIKAVRSRLAALDCLEAG
jgi:hypothetical protein